MIISSNILKNEYKEYSNKNTKICREVRKGNYIKIINGLYETNPDTDGYLLASSIYGPSYLSFDYALSYYGLIPESVVTFTSATYGKGKRKSYTNAFGTFIYRDVPENVYFMNIDIFCNNGYSYQIATKEKALCDKLYILKPISSIKKMTRTLLDDLRIDKNELFKINMDDIKILSGNYHCHNVTLLYQCLEDMMNE